jgi:hypothetical protein
VAPDLKADPPGGINTVRHAYKLFSTVRDLPSDRFGLPNLLASGAKYEVAALIDLDTLGALKRQGNDAGIATAGDFKVIFQMLLFSPKYDVNSGVDLMD